MLFSGLAKSVALRSISRVLCAGLLASIAPCDAALALDWDKLPDGRVIIEVKDVRLALPSEGADTQLVRFTDRLATKNEMTLGEVIRAPDVARRMFSNTSLMNVGIPNVLDRDDLFLRKFPRSEFRSLTVGFAIGKGALTDCESWARTYAKLLANLASGDVQISPSGWGRFKMGERPPVWAYVYPSLDAANQPFFPGLSCDSFNICGSTKCLGPNLEVSYNFSGRIFTEVDWLSVDRRVHRLLDYILLHDLK
ncbi:hypothetical protein QA641_00470 [Bradyrhizobium sp. CB1650]|uniref:hypothetical protein n=1 Tax=Bradyrhizobium sp. CB1650 TaxID=3039153 RepID=UPI0024355540|nr:hypothetical protein [Bradyrhizobium sp. CB1650]WGD52464.1 hypothetical protein QA641_00470 [Bradyrhizobium sp. CB1650]